MTRDFSLQAEKHGLVNGRPEGCQIAGARSVQCGDSFVLGLHARRRGGVGAGEQGALILVQRGGQCFRGPVVEAGRHHGRLCHRVDQRAAALRDLVRGDRQDGNSAKGDRKTRGNAEPGAWHAPRRAAPRESERRPCRAKIWPQLVHPLCNDP